MDILTELIENKVLIFAGLSWIMAQIIKIIIALITEKRFRPDRIFGDGGMPSTHTATVVSLMLMCGFVEGWGSSVFALSAIFAIVVMHDATGVRRETGKQAVVILDMIKVMQEYFWERDAAAKAEKLKVLVGHTPLQVFMGAVVGVVTGAVFPV
jgi:acid phosphatase family membrane protein YuiD